MKYRLLVLSVTILFVLPKTVFSQFTEKVIYNNNDSTNDYYLAVKPLSGNIKGVQVLIVSFMPPEFVLAESKLQNIGYGNDLLTIIASMGGSLWADSLATARLNQIFIHVAERYSADTSKFVLGGFMYGGTIALRYAERCYENPLQFPIQPKAVFAIDCPVDLIALNKWCERQIKKNYYPGTVSDGKFISGELNKKLGSFSEHPEKYIHESPFYLGAQTTGNEKFLLNIPVRLYYDTDIVWELKNRRNSDFDTYIPEGSEMIARLMLAGNSEAEFVSSKQPGIRSTGLRSPHSWSVVDEVDCVQWIKKSLKIFNPQAYQPAYFLPVPDGWSTEQFSLPPDFAKKIAYKGVEDLRFFPGWGDVKSEEHWSYAYLWSLEGNPNLEASDFQQSLITLYTGLVGRNIEPRKIPKEKLFPVEATIQKIKTTTGDLKTFEGTVHMLDYIAQVPMTLNVRIHIKDCTGKTPLFILFEISPKPFDHPNWKKLDLLNTEFKCVH
jgi:hypothetical protein